MKGAARATTVAIRNFFGKGRWAQYAGTVSSSCPLWFVLQRYWFLQLF